MKTFRLLPLLLGILIALTFGLQNCKKPDPDPVTPGGTTNPGSSTTTTAPTFNTATVPLTSGIASTSATVSAVIDASGGSSISQHGFVYSKTSQTPTLTDTKTELGSTSGPFPLTITSKLTDLEANTIYYVRAYATNDKGTGYGTMGQLKTTASLTIPVFDANTTPKTTDIGTTSVSLSGYINGQGGGSITQHGVVYAELVAAVLPTIDNGPKVELGPVVGAFPYEVKAALKDLKSNTTYNCRIFATNAGGTAYGPMLQFKTQQVGAAADIEGVVLVGQGYSMIGIDAKTGAKKWEYKNATNYARMDQAYPVVLGSSVFFTDQTSVYRLNNTTADKIWEFALPLKNSSTSSLGTGNGQIQLVQNGKLITINASQGTRIGTDLSLTGSGGGNMAPVIEGGNMYLDLGALYSVSTPIEPKAITWKTTLTTDEGGGFMALSEGILVKPTPIGRKFMGFDAKTGARKWEYATGQYAEDGVPTIANGIVYIPGSGAVFHAIDLNTGTKKWTFSNPYRGDITNVGAAVDNGVVYVPMPHSNGGGSLFALDALTGAKKWEVSIGVLHSPVVAGNTIYVTGVTSTGGTLLALDKSNGATIWKFTLPGAGVSASPPTVVDAAGTVYYPAESGMKQ